MERETGFEPATLSLGGKEEALSLLCRGECREQGIHILVYTSSEVPMLEPT